MITDKPRRFLGLILTTIRLGGRRSLALVIVLAAVSAVLEAIGVGSVMPFIAAATNSGIVDRSDALRALEAWTRLDRNQFIVFLGVLFAFATLVANVANAASMVALSKFSARIGHLLSSHLLRGFLGRPYDYFLGANTAEIGALVLTSTRRVSEGIVSPFITMLAKSVSASCILAVLAWMDPFVAFTVAVLIVPIYGLTYYAVRGRLNHLGAKIALEDRESHKLSTEALAGIKDLKILGRTDYVARRFEGAARELAAAQATAAILSFFPKFVIETVGVLMIVSVILASLATTRDASAAVSLAALYAYAGYRLLPAIQAIFGSVSIMRYNAESLESVAAAIDSAKLDQTAGAIRREGAAQGRMIQARVELRDITYRYPEKRRPSLESVSIEVPRGAHVAIVGTSGSGKSTALDILVGLLSPERGGIYVDDRRLEQADMAEFRSRIGYVSQSIFLADASISENVAFGIPRDLIDARRVRAAAEAAQIHDFIESSLPDGYDTHVGERGVRLSGGQRQRLAIARAVYHEPELLILDEATNALDSTTEGAFMDTVRALAGSKTIISVAHRLTSVRACDRIYVMAKGRIVGQGTYDSLDQSSPEFRELVESSRGGAR